MRYKKPKQQGPVSIALIIFFGVILVAAVIFSVNRIAKRADPLSYQTEAADAWEQSIIAEAAAE